MTTPDFIKAMLAVLMWREDSGDGVQGMTAVGLVVANRVRAGWNGGDWCAVMAAHNQFSSMVIEGDPNTIRWPDTRDPKFQLVLGKVDTIYDGTEYDTTDGALYYANLSTMNSAWFRTNIVAKPEEHPRVGTVGAQTFFR
jgi:spore germination cell wall hydrolase CwlJ-like protein